MSDQNPESATPPSDPQPTPPAYPPAPPAAGSYPPPPGAYPPPAAPAYGAPGAQGGYTPYPTGPKTNTLAIISLIASLAGVFIVPFIGQVVGIITGHMGLKQIKERGENGRGLALAGVIIGYVTLALTILAIVIIIIVIAATAGSSGYYDYSS